MTAPLVTEKHLQETIVEAAQRLGWWVYHPFDSRKSTPGWPDLVLLRPPQALFVELKDENGKATDEQTRVLEMLEDCGFEVHIWRPSHLDDALARLQERR